MGNSSNKNNIDVQPSNQDGGSKRGPFGSSFRSKNKTLPRFEGLPVKQFFDLYDLSAAQLGSGSFSIVKLAMSKKSKEQVAVKIMDKKGLSRKDLRNLYHETDIMAKLDHPNVVKFYNYYEDPLSLYIVLQYAAGGDLFDRIVSRPSFSEEHAKVIVRTIAGALKYCSDKGITHRDIKPDNILLLNRDDDFSKLVVADFGFAIQTEPDLKGFELLQTMCGTRAYVAPEVISGRQYNYKCDIWSVGVIVFIILSGYSPFNVNVPELDIHGAKVPEEKLAKERNNAMLRLVKKGQWKFQPREVWSEISDDAKDFVARAMCVKVNGRFDYEEMLGHKWLHEEKVEEEHVIDLDALKRFNAKRKVLAAAKARLAAKAFVSLMESSKQMIIDEENGQTVPKPTGKMSNNLTNASAGAFLDLLNDDEDDAEDKEAGVEAVELSDDEQEDEQGDTSKDE